MTKFKDRMKFILRIILYISIIFFIPIIITALYIVHNDGINAFQRGISTFLLIILCTLLLLIICSQLKYGLVFGLNKLKFPENLVKNNVLKNTLKIFLRLLLYTFIIFLSALIIIILIDFSDKDLNIFPLEATQFLIMIAFIGILFMIHNDIKKLYNFSSDKIKLFEVLTQKIIEKVKKIKEKILTIKLDFFKNTLEKTKKILNSVSDKVESLVDLLENKINYPEKSEFKGRCDFSNLRNEIVNFAKIIYQILAYLTVFSVICILIPITIALVYQLLIYLITLLMTIWKVILAIISQL
ncbi:hypothetical protein C7Y58_08405 [Fusobacterium nucleatum subsp. nucleatum ATCC 25586]|uniref:Uncharacterized protein n=2 Tax=Fusobacterium nucleatum subsp. nucleatum TaxID=76856 RepID=Q8REM3_FUSNN|nr:hypothetical protein [Fusobacterium nucleatum]AAL95272.1 Hypothetical protein FN1076 [Fusobacterium nucleatum subsp. nucleatum ATCC 25586]ALF24473.1 hypothetical protein RO05_08860 [Fusobacterium nucleatum subsp. nucleatum ChDC F316]ASG26263.1 hypothetical protein RN84_05015 [Fusobacterium nucleatum subsp. nucleatum]AVQ15429.1 hypothetical protein C7Y58_08405 [Fusobacterium nucleatum subsp. nucleatum ATCC 25586]KUL98856.1 hypothetical protein RO03_04800 [Fusobacterium nucleatum subsp. nucle